MGRYTKREFQIGDYWLGHKGDSPAWHRCWLDGRQVRRASLGTADLEEAKRLLTEWFIQNRQAKDEKPEEALLADVIRRYKEGHSENLASAEPNAWSLGLWLDFWGTASVADLRDMARQERFHQFLRAKGHKPSTIDRTIVIGKAALNRAWKRGELMAVPYIARPKVGEKPPRGRPLTVDELRRLHGESVEHVQTFIRWMLGTAARPEAIITLTEAQIDREHGLITLNPEGREQNKKFRPVVKLVPVLAEERWKGNRIRYGGQNVGSVKKAFQRGRERAKLGDKVTPYSLRHTAARWMRSSGVPMDEVAQQLGHRSANRTTEIYTAFSPDYLQRAAAALDDLVRKTCVH